MRNAFSALVLFGVLASCGIVKDSAFEWGRPTPGAINIGASQSDAGERPAQTAEKRNQLHANVLSDAAVSDDDRSGMAFVPNPKAKNGKGFYIDKTEVTAGEFAKRAAEVQTQKKLARLAVRFNPSGESNDTRDWETFCTFGHPQKQDHPMNCVNWWSAQAYCELRGARLPTEQEWNLAASNGNKSTLWGLGHDFDKGKYCFDRWHNSLGTCSVASFGANDYGIHGMSGNVWEWTLSKSGGEIVSGYDTQSLYKSQPERTVCGGSWAASLDYLVVAARDWVHPGTESAFLGFRCAADPK